MVVNSVNSFVQVNSLIAFLFRNSRNEENLISCESNLVVNNLFLHPNQLTFFGLCNGMESIFYLAIVRNFRTKSKREVYLRESSCIVLGIRRMSFVAIG